MSVLAEGIFISGMKYCRKCYKRKRIEDFPVYRNGRTSPYCLACFIPRVRNNTASVDQRGNIFFHIKALFHGAKQRTEKSKFKAANKNEYEDIIPFDITENHLYSVYENQGGKCAISGRQMTLGKPESGLPDKDAMSIDRVIPSLGYTKGNVRFVTHQVNIAKGRYGDKDLIQLALDIVKFQDGPSKIS